MVRLLTGSTLEERDDYLVIRTPGNPTFWWGNYILLPAAPRADDAERWKKWFRAEFPDTEHQAYGIDSTDGFAGESDALAKLGVDVEESSILTATSLIAAPESDAEVRKLASDTDWDQMVDLDLAVYPTEDENPDGHRLYLRRRIRDQRALTESSRSAWFGGFVDGLLVGSLGIVSDGSGIARYQSVQTHPDFQRRGIARRMLCDAALHANNVLDAGTLVIAADPAYHAIELYRSVGFADVERQIQLEVKPTND